MPKDMAGAQREDLGAAFKAVRRRTEALAEGFSAEDLCVQSMPDVSPGKWHLAHVTWFWEAFLLKDARPGYAPFDPRFNFLFNSYYEAVGERHARPERGLVTRPSIEAVRAYRASVDAAVTDWLDRASDAEFDRFRPIVLTGLAHEEQHQELFLTDIKHVLSCTRFLEPAFKAEPIDPPPLASRAPEPDWVAFDGGLEAFGHDGQGFAYDNEGPRHKAWLEPFALASRPVSNAEFLAFMEDGGYRRPEFWLSDGWAAIQAEGREAPFYWRRGEDGWREFTLHGLEPLHPDAPVSHLDYYEADAFAAWTGFRLPEEREWELAARRLDPSRARWADPAGRLHPEPQADGDGLEAMFGEVWEWTRSAYSPYPRYRAAAGAIGEYNGKFMCGQFVLRGGSALTPPGHVRASYRNFFPPNAQWQMTGLRLAREV